MKVLITSDWHGDHVTLGVMRFPEIEAAAIESVRVAIEQKVDLYAFTGDLTDPDSGTMVFEAVELAGKVIRLLTLAGIPSVWIPGNHDVIENGRGRSTLAPLTCVDFGAKIIEQPARIEVTRHSGASIKVICLPFTAASHGYDVEHFLRDCEPSDLVLAHLAVPGVQPGEETTEIPRGREVVLPAKLAMQKAKVVVNGHYHRAQVSPDGVLIPGSLARLTFGEADHKPSFLMVEI